MNNKNQISRKGKSVRFNSNRNNTNEYTTIDDENDNNDYDGDDRKMRANRGKSEILNRNNNHQSKRQQKRRPNTDDDDDDLDDDDNYEHGDNNDVDDEYDNNLKYKTDDDDDINNDTDIAPGSVITEHSTILNLKRKRRLKRDGLDTTDIIDNTDNDHIHTDDKNTSLIYEGIAIEPFNMNNEQNDGTGYFDGDTYVFRRDNPNDGGEPDAWLDQLNNEQNDTNDDENNDTSMKDNTIRYKNQNTKKRQQEYADDDDNDDNENDNYNKKKQRLQTKYYDNWPIEKLYSTIIPLLSNDNETVLQAIVRYGNILKQHRRTTRNNTIMGQHTTINSSPNEMSSIATNINDKQNTAKSSIDVLTDLSNVLLLRGIVEIYQKTKSDLQKLVPDQESNVNDYNDAIAFASQVVETVSNQQNETNITTRHSSSTSSTGNKIQWIYYGSQDQQIHGPYTTQQMIGWISAGYFRGPAAVHVRTVQYTSNNSNNTNHPSSIDDNNSTQILQQQSKETSMQDDLLSDLLDDDDDDNNAIKTDSNDYKTDSKQIDTNNASSSNEGAITSSTPIYGDWIISDKVDFTQYI
jgi:CD2 antigen cytoplasmic tail-binding protein 2